MNDPCKACGAIKCATIEICQCCGKCRNCGQTLQMHGPAGPTANPPIWVTPPPCGPESERVLPWWGDQFIHRTTCEPMPVFTSTKTTGLVDAHGVARNGAGPVGGVSFTVGTTTGN